MKQAEGHRQPSILQVEFESSEIKFVTSNVHVVEIKAKMTPVVSIGNLIPTVCKNILNYHTLHYMIIV